MKLYRCTIHRQYDGTLLLTSARASGGKTLRDTMIPMPVLRALGASRYPLARHPALPSHLKLQGLRAYLGPSGRDVLAVSSIRKPFTRRAGKPGAFPYAIAWIEVPTPRRADTTSPKGIRRQVERVEAEEAAKAMELEREMDAVGSKALDARCKPSCRLCRGVDPSTVHGCSCHDKPMTSASQQDREASDIPEPPTEPRRLDVVGRIVRRFITVLLRRCPDHEIRPYDPLLHRHPHAIAKGGLPCHMTRDEVTLLKDTRQDLADLLEGLCECRPCVVCQQEGRGDDPVVCGVCHMCTRCHQHAAGCQGCLYDGA